jgi:Flp pilus assembly pilin Flp
MRKTLEECTMEFLTRTFVKARELAKRLGEGQTMTEYALILAAVAIVVFVTYEVMGQDIGSLVNRIDTALTTS